MGTNNLLFWPIIRAQNCAFLLAPCFLFISFLIKIKCHLDGVRLAKGGNGRKWCQFHLRHHLLAYRFIETEIGALHFHFDILFHLRVFIVYLVHLIVIIIINFTCVLPCLRYHSCLFCLLLVLFDIFFVTWEGRNTRNRTGGAQYSVRLLLASFNRAWSRLRRPFWEFRTSGNVPKQSPEGKYTNKTKRKWGRLCFSE